MSSTTFYDTLVPTALFLCIPGTESNNRMLNACLNILPLFHGQVWPPLLSFKLLGSGFILSSSLLFLTALHSGLHTSSLTNICGLDSSQLCAEPWAARKIA